MSQEDEKPEGQEPEDKPDALESAQNELKAAREAAETAKSEADSEKLVTAQERVGLAEEKAKLAEEKAKQAASATTDEGKKYGEDYVKKLRDEAARYRVAARDEAEKVKALEDATKSEIERATARGTELEQKLVAAEHKLLRVEVAQKKKVPAELVDRLVGDTKEDLEKDADTLLKSVAPASGLGSDGGSRGGEGPTGKSQMDSWIRGAAGFTR